MEKLGIAITFLVGAGFILIGLKTIITRKTTVLIQLWSWGNSDSPHSGGGGYSESTQTGFVAVLIGVIGVLLGISVLARLY